MRNFLRIRDGDRFWYERYLSKEVIVTSLSGKFLAKKADNYFIDLAGF